MPQRAAHPTLPLMSAGTRLTLADLLTLIREAALAFNQDKAPRMAAAISYYAMTSLAPLLLLAVAVAGYFLTDSAVVDSLFGPKGTITQSIGVINAEFLKNLVNNQAGIRRSSLITSAVAFIVTFMGATGLFVQVQDALNSMWGADAPPRQGVISVTKTRLISFVMIIGIGLLLLFFLAANTWLSAAAHFLGDRFGVSATLLRVSTFLLSTFLLTFVFAAIFQILPAVKLQWREVVVGGAVTATLFSLGQLLIGFYFGRAAPGSAFSAAGTLIALLFWIYYSALIFFFGAEITWVYSQEMGTRAGGAANPAKKEALALKGAHLDTTPSPQERRAAQALRGSRDSGRRVLGWPVEFPRVLPQVPTRAEGRVLPSVRGALWNLLLALMAVPAVIVLRVIGLTGGRRQKK